MDPAKKSYRPLFLDHFDKKDAAAAAAGISTNANNDGKENQRSFPEFTNPSESSPNANPAMVSNYTRRLTNSFPFLFLIIFRLLSLWTFFNLSHKMTF
jgi:hypothetical protein